MGIRTSLCVAICLSFVQEESKGIDEEDSYSHLLASGLSGPERRLEIPLELM